MQKFKCLTQEKKYRSLKKNQEGFFPCRKYHHDSYFGKNGRNFHENG